MNKQELSKFTVGPGGKIYYETIYGNSIPVFGLSRYGFLSGNENVKKRAKRVDYYQL